MLKIWFSKSSAEEAMQRSSHQDAKKTATKTTATKTTTKRCATKKAEVVVNVDAESVGFRAGDVYQTLAAAEAILSPSGSSRTTSTDFRAGSSAALSRLSLTFRPALFRSSDNEEVMTWSRTEARGTL